MGESVGVVRGSHADVDRIAGTLRIKKEKPTMVTETT